MLFFSTATVHSLHHNSTTFTNVHKRKKERKKEREMEKKRNKQTNKEKILSLAMAIPRQLGVFLGLQIPSMPQEDVEFPSILKPRSQVATHVDLELTSDWFLQVELPLVGEGQLLVRQVIAKEDKMW